MITLAEGTMTTTPCSRCGGQRLETRITYTLERDDATIVFRDVPATVCDECGEEVLTASVAIELEQIAEAAIAAGVKHEVRQYKPTAA
jgi:YgiT-type zinc finger domain-containing protein